MSKYVVVIGGVQPGADQAQVIKKLAVILKSEEKKIQTLLAGGSFKVKSGLDKEQAGKVKSALEKTGAKCLIKEVAPASTTVKPKKKSASKPETIGLQMENPDLDEKPVPPKSKKLQMENPEPGHDAGDPIETCPSCGYEAMDPNDPLITAHDGMGECPKCGVIRQRVAPTRIKGSWDSVESHDEKPVSRRPPVWMLASVGVLLVVLVVVIGLLVFGSKPEPQTAGDGPAVSAPAAAARDDEPAGGEVVEEDAGDEKSGEGEVICMLPANSSHTITISGYAPLFHDAQNWADIDGEYKIYKNPMEKVGMNVTIYSISFSRETFDMPNIRDKNGLVFSVYGKKTARQLELRPVFWWDNDNKSSSTVFVANDVLTIMEMANVNESEYLEKMTKGNRKPGQVVWRDFTVYPVNIDLNIDVPDIESIQSFFKPSAPGLTQVILNATSFSLTRKGRTETLKVHPEQFKFRLGVSPAVENQKIVGIKVKKYWNSLGQTQVSCPGIEMQ